jgi:cytochrome c oxidase subunit 3
VAAHAHAAGGHEAVEHEHHGPPPANQSSRVNTAVLGMLLFIVSEVMIFGAFFTAYFFIRVVNHDPWPGPGFELPKTVAFFNTCILVSSSFTIHFAQESLKKDNRLGLKVGMVCTFLLGLTFLFIQINEYWHLGIAANETAQASIFYGLTGLHGAHVTIGLMLLAFVTIRSFRGHYSSGGYLGMEVPGIYWHFVDVMWIVVFFSVYII